MYERVLPADDVPSRPPTFDVWMWSISDQNPFPPLIRVPVFPAEILQLVHSLKIEPDASIAAVDFKSVTVAVTCRKSGGFKGTNGTVLEFRQEEGGVIDGNLAQLLGSFGAETSSVSSEKRAFLDECLHQTTDRVEFATQIPSKVNDVSV